MRIGVVASEMERRTTGVGRYLSGMLHGLTRWNHGHEWILYFQGRSFSHELFGDPALTPVFCGFDGHPVLWEQAALPWRLSSDDLDVLLAPAFTTPFGSSVPAVVVIHDLAFELLPEEFGFRERWRRRLLARRASRTAARVLTDSARTAELLRSVYGVDEDRIGVVPLGVDAALLGRPRSDGAARAAELGVRPPYLLVVGTVLERRLPKLVLEAFAVLSSQHPQLQLVLAGDNRMRRPERLRSWISDLGLGDAVRTLGWVEEPLLPDLYRGAELSLYLSSYEGFGIPPLESLAFGTPVVVAEGMALDEIWPGYPYRVPSPTVTAVVETVRRILDSPAEAAAVVNESGSVLGRIGWDECSRRLVRELEMAVSP